MLSILTGSFIPFSLPLLPQSLPPSTTEPPSPPPQQQPTHPVLSARQPLSLARHNTLHTQWRTRTWPRFSPLSVRYPSLESTRPLFPSTQIPTQQSMANHNSSSHSGWRATATTSRRSRTGPDANGLRPPRRSPSQRTPDQLSPARRLRTAPALELRISRSQPD